MKPQHILVILVPALLLAACGQKAREQSGSDANAMQVGGRAVGAMQQAMGANGSAMPRGTAAMPGMASGTGMVTAIDPKAGNITIKHGPISSLHWPAMTMIFKANPPSLVDQVAVGDQVTFELKVGGASNEVIAISKQ